jgi:nucleotide-binding universal stress UspA family protein
MTALLHSILVPLDGSAMAEQAIGPAAALARAAKARIRLVLVHQSLPAPTTREQSKLYVSMELATRRAAREYLKVQVDRLRRQGCPSLTKVVLSGQPGEALVEHAQEWGASLIVMCTHGRGPIMRAWLGSVADHVVRHAGIPVLLMRPSENGAPAAIEPGGQVLVPLDGSPFGEAALEPAKAIARLIGADLRLMEVVRPVPSALAEPTLFTDGFDEHLAELRRVQAEEYLDHTVDRLRTNGLRVRSEVVLSQSMAGTILDVAASVNVRMVAMATHGRSGLNRLLLGGVADKVVRGANCPVLVCPSARANGGTSSRKRAVAMAIA